jgi:hypothetical protein
MIREAAWAGTVFLLARFARMGGQAYNHAKPRTPVTPVANGDGLR